MDNEERERRAAFIREARAENITGRADLTANVAEHHRHDGQRAVFDWQRRREKPEPVPARERGLDTLSWANFVDARVAAAIVRERQRAGELLVELIAAERHRARDVFAEVLAEERRQHGSERTALAELRVEVAKLASLLAVVRDERAAERAAVLDLPALPRARVVN